MLSWLAFNASQYSMYHASLREDLERLWIFYGRWIISSHPVAGDIKILSQETYFLISSRPCHRKTPTATTFDSKCLSFNLMAQKILLHCILWTRGISSNLLKKRQKLKNWANSFGLRRIDFWNALGTHPLLFMSRLNLHWKDHPTNLTLGAIIPNENPEITISIHSQRLFSLFWWVIGICAKRL